MIRMPCSVTPACPYCLREGVGGRVKKRKKRNACHFVPVDSLGITAQMKSLATLTPGELYFNRIKSIYIVDLGPPWGVWG
jgi:hypothetical protein